MRYFRNALEELQQIRQRCLREPPAEAPFRRLLFAGLPCYPLYSSFIRMFSTQGGLFVRSTTCSSPQAAQTLSTVLIPGPAGGRVLPKGCC